MKRELRPRDAVTLIAAATAFALGAGLLAAGADAPAPPARESASGPAQSAPPSASPLPDFKPTEELPADAAVAFPTDI